MPKLILALAGEIGCGKGTIAKLIIARHGGVMFRYSDSLRDILRRTHQEMSRENLSRVSTALRQVFGESFLSHVMAEDIRASSAEIIIIDGVRRREDIDRFVAIPGFHLVYIDAPESVRYERVIRRAENHADAEKSRADFQRESQFETESTIRSLKSIADYHIENDGWMDELTAKIDAFIGACK